jgi:hypothetical protein
MGRWGMGHTRSRHVAGGKDEEAVLAQAGQRQQHAAQHEHSVLLHVADLYMVIIEGRREMRR